MQITMRKGSYIVLHTHAVFGKVHVCVNDTYSSITVEEVINCTIPLSKRATETANAIAIDWADGAWGPVVRDMRGSAYAHTHYTTVCKTCKNTWCLEPDECVTENTK